LRHRFGPGPYFVEFEVLVRGKRHFFTLKTAPTDDMPHSVFTFMDMVHRRVWDKTVIIHHWQHITQAAPISSDGENKRGILKGELSFPEHGDFYRHEKYTVGFAGRPGGPEWYINLADNYESHGPGRQDHSKVLNDADPCFAEVVRGRDVIDLMRKISIEAMRNKGNGGLEFSSIETARIIVLKNDGNATE
jgi:Cyclophilin type peptidyl-prolyl cis-trans isomerase/CLD.